jgi:hypothetical protein
MAKHKPPNEEDLERAIREVIFSGRFAGAAVSDIESDPEQCHSESKATVNLRALLHLKTAFRNLVNQ